MPTATAAAETAQGTSGPGGGSGRVALSVTPNSLPAPGELLSPGQLEELLASLPLSELSASRVAEYLAALPEVGVLAQLQIGLLPGETLGLVGLEENLTEAIEALGPSATLGELVEVSGLLPQLETQLGGLLGLVGGTLGGEAQQELGKALQTLNLDQLVSSLLATATEPGQLGGLSELAGGLFEKLGAGNVEELLGAPLEAPFNATTVEGAAKELGTTAEAVSGELGQSASELPATANMLTAPATEGKLLAVAPAVKGLAVGLLGGGEGGEEGSGEGSGSGSGSGQGTGGQGGAGGNTTPAPGGAGGSTGPLTVVVNVPPTSSASTGAPAAGGARATKGKIAKLRVLRAGTRGTHATVVLQVPAAGRLVLSGSGLRSRTVTVRKSGKVTVHLGLSKAGVASLHRHRRGLRVKLHASLKGAGGASSTTAVLAFR